MSPSALVDHGKELEVNLVEPAGEVDHEGRPYDLVTTRLMKASGRPHLSRSVGPALSQFSSSPKSAATAARAATRDDLHQVSFRAAAI
jgi:hypothetical protein